MPVIILPILHIGWKENPFQHESSVRDGEENLQSLFCVEIDSSSPLKLIWGFSGLSHRNQVGIFQSLVSFFLGIVFPWEEEVTEKGIIVQKHVFELNGSCIQVCFAYWHADEWIELD